ncbi:histidine phosphatase family protein [Pelagerythrobacter rhizovicinus]|uniref:Histidine phosphatase family protein n=1 Tax=Pelagerythrobacter rhizovicinus TaxID=2268576 RepID=A0A4Q2KLY2_9SPHN|nr:histidine phosphatase family protein [Pelagerythrobacter rhizovicinus]RXZ65427.1 histidine phosphatase family protein [Pelagerythrobacter rhizovicinus]
MTAKILLIRHATHSDLGSRLSGRSRGGSLSAVGYTQAHAIARYLAEGRLDRIETSPVTRARETAAILSSRTGLPVTVAPALDEIDFGEWEGRAFAELEDDPRWRDWNAARSVATAPDGESMASVQSRALAHIADTAKSTRGTAIAMVTHCDVIRAVVAGVLGLSLDNLLRFSVDPASVTRLEVGTWGAKVCSINEAVPCIS